MFTFKYPFSDVQKKTSLGSAGAASDEEDEEGIPEEEPEDFSEGTIVSEPKPVTPGNHGMRCRSGAMGMSKVSLNVIDNGDMQCCC